MTRSLYCSSVGAVVAVEVTRGSWVRSAAPMTVTPWKLSAPFAGGLDAVLDGVAGGVALVAGSVVFGDEGWPAVLVVHAVSAMVAATATTTTLTGFMMLTAFPGAASVAADPTSVEVAGPVRG
jgi:hypothetical protein